MNNPGLGCPICGVEDCVCPPFENGGVPRAHGLRSSEDDPASCCLVCGCDDCVCPPDDDGTLIAWPGSGRRAIDLRSSRI